MDDITYKHKETGRRVQVPASDTRRIAELDAGERWERVVPKVKPASRPASAA